MKADGVFVYGYYGLNNFGDDLLALSVFENLPGRTPDTCFYFRNYGEIGPLLREDPSRVVLTGLENGLISGQSRLLSILRYYRNHWNVFGQCREFVLGGGTLIQSHSSPKSRLLLLGLLVLARLRRMKINAYGLGIGKLDTRMAKLAAKAAFGLCANLNFRDSGSLEAFRNLGMRKNARLTDDLAYALAFPPAGSRKPDPHPCIGVTLVEPYLNGKAFAGKRSVAMNAMRKALANWTARGWRIRFISCQEAILPNGHEVSDRKAFEELIRSCEIGDGAVENCSLTYPRIQQVFSGLAVVVGMRFHGHLIGALQGIPFVGFSYDVKVEDLCRSYNMPYRSIENLTDSWLIESVTQALQMKPDTGCTERHVAGSRRNFHSAEG